MGRRGRVLAKVANFVRADSMPTIVAGDFNDVSWSATIHQLTRTERLVVELKRLPDVDSDHFLLCIVAVLAVE
jgi:endonuclease/exonuclease/phosphatase (EEP) superfamily protein YafD